jgi:hypothetical protein
MELIKLGGNLESPRDSKPSDYPSVGSGSAGESSGAGQLVKKSADPASSSDFKVSKGESQSTSVKWDCAVDLKTGQVSPNVATSKY